MGAWEEQMEVMPILLHFLNAIKPYFFAESRGQTQLDPNKSCELTVEEAGSSPPVEARYQLVFFLGFSSIFHALNPVLIPELPKLHQNSYDRFFFSASLGNSKAF